MFRIGLNVFANGRKLLNIGYVWGNCQQPKCQRTLINCEKRSKDNQRMALGMVAEFLMLGIKQHVESAICSILNEADCSQQFYDRCGKCIVTNGDYFERYTNIFLICLYCFLYFLISFIECFYTDIFSINFK